VAVAVAVAMKAVVVVPDSSATFPLSQFQALCQ